MIRCASIFAAVALMAAAQPPAIPTVPATASPETAVVMVTLDNFHFRPNLIRMVADQPTILRLVDRQGGHSFSAPDFFAAATMSAQDRSAIGHGKVELAPGEQRDILLTPARGQYRVKCRHTLHAAFGMTALIDVGEPLR